MGKMKNVEYAQLVLFLLSSSRIPRNRETNFDWLLEILSPSLILKMAPRKANNIVCLESGNFRQRISFGFLCALHSADYILQTRLNLFN